MIDLIETIVAKVKNENLADGLTGGFHNHHPSPKTALPFAVVYAISATTEFTTEKDYYEPVTVQFSFYGSTMESVRPFVKRFKDAFLWQTLAVTADGGGTFGVNLTNEASIYDPGDQELISAWHYVLEFEFMLERNLP